MSLYKNHALYDLVMTAERFGVKSISVQSLRDLMERRYDELDIVLQAKNAEEKAPSK